MSPVTPTDKQQSSYENLAKNTTTPQRAYTTHDRHKQLEPSQDETSPVFKYNDQSTMISPSKARAQAQRSHQITLIDLWLESLFTPNPIPAHLRKWKTEVDAEYGDNDSSGGSGGVLRALQELQHANLAADKLAELLHAARVQELETLKARGSAIHESPAAKLMLEIQDALSPLAQDVLSSLATSSVFLGCLVNVENDEGVVADATLTSRLASAMYARTHTSQLLEAGIADLKAVHSEVQDQVTSLENSDGNVKKEINASDSDRVQAQTAQHNRETKQISQKISEYHDRIAQLERVLQNLLSTPPQHREQSIGEVQTVENALSAKRRIDGRRKKVQQLEQEISFFHGLPPDLEASRNEVKRATAELETLKNKRERLFEHIAHG